MKKGFDNDKYLSLQSEHIRERIGHFDNKLYLEFGGNSLMTITHPAYYLDLNQTASCACFFS